MSMPYKEDMKECPLLKKSISRLDCFMITEVREDNCDMEFSPNEFDIEKAEKVCPKCGWCDTIIK